MIQSLARMSVAVFLMLAFVLQATGSVLAGTTGKISGTVIDATTQRPIAGAKVSAASPSQSASTTADANGRFTFVSLSPDTYTVSAESTGKNETAVLTGVTVQSDQSVQITLAQNDKIKEIGRVGSRAASSLVKPGTTADVYSISATQQDKASQFGGGGTLNSAWSAITSVPGVFVAPGQNGYIGAGPSVSIRGGDYNQIGYELDGIPVNRSFDNYPSTSLSSLGQQEVQVYTGATPANSEAEGISGYINQVIKTGTAPGFESITLAGGAPALYNKFSFETGGANPSRTFSYYVGLGAYNQQYRYGDQFNGASLNNTYGTPLTTCASVPAASFNPKTVPSCFTANGTPFNSSTNSYVLGPYQLDAQSRTESRDSVVNLHFGIPHKDGSKDDIQLLLDVNHLSNFGYTSPNDQGGDAYLNTIGVGPSTYLDGYQTQAPYGTLLPSTYTGGGNVASRYAYPFSAGGRAQNSLIPGNLEDETVNNQNILKLQYQHNIGSNAYLRVYGYTYYSDWAQNGPNSTLQNYVGYASSDYELNSHSRGLSASFVDQINDKNLLSLQTSYTTSTATRYNNSGIGLSQNTTIGYLVNGANPYNGTCYGLPTDGSDNATAAPGCNFGTLPFQKLTAGQAINGVAPTTGLVCGGGPCQYVIVGGGPSATYNQVKPKFTTASLTDDFRPTTKLDINVGLRYDLFAFQGANTFNSNARTLFYNAYNAAAAANGTAPIAFDPTGAASLLAFPEFQPRLGATYTLDPSTVLRASYGRYAQAPNTAYEQYNYLQPNDISSLANFGKFGLPTTPGHDVRPELSNNYDFSLERQFSRDTAVKITPFLRKTQDQIQSFFLDQKTNFVSGLNVGNQTSQGVELEVDKGDFGHDGFAGKLSFTYTNSYIRYNREPNGQSIIDPINAAINKFNSYTKGGGGFPYYSLATGTTKGVGSNTGGPGFVANPYYNAPLQGLLDPNGNFPTFDTFPGGIGTVASTYGAPYVATFLLQYKHGPLTFTPAIQFNAGQRYGTPENTPGIAPDEITGVLPGSTANDPRYQQFGSPGPNGAPYDSTTSNQTIPIPDLFTNRFDALGAFVQPSFLQFNMQVAYQANKQVTLVATFANIFTKYFGGSKNGFNAPGAQGYGLTSGAGGGISPVGNVYNPGDGPIQQFLNVPYNPLYGAVPFNMYLEARIKI